MKNRARTIENTTYKVTYRTRGETVTAFSQLSAKEAAQKAYALESEGWKHVTIRPETL